MKKNKHMTNFDWWNIKWNIEYGIKDLYSLVASAEHVKRCIKLLDALSN